MIINHSKAILHDHYARRHYPAARARLMRAGLFALTTLTLYTWIYIQIASASGAFIPN